VLRCIIAGEDCKINYSMMALRVKDWVQWYEGFKIMN